VRTYAALTVAFSLAVVAVAATPQAKADPGNPIGTATMRVIGAAGPVTLRYQINGGPEQTETDVTLPWEKQYPVYNEISTSVSADGGDTVLTCTIIMDGNLASYQSEPRPTCSFAYFG
jgi:hypothetical protein